MSKKQTGGKNMKTLLQNRGWEMKPYSVIDTYNQAVYDICPTLKTTYDNNNSIFVIAPIIEHNLDFKIQKYIKENPMKNEKSNIKDSSKSFSSNTELRTEDGCMVDNEGRRYRIRKLTPTERFRLQDVSDEDIEKIRSYVDSETAIICNANGEPIMNMGFEKPSKNARKITITVNGEQREYYSSQLIWKNKDKGISKTAQYKLAGNSICIAPMYHIFRKLFIEKECDSNQLTLF